MANFAHLFDNTSAVAFVAVSLLLSVATLVAAL